MTPKGRAINLTGIADEAGKDIETQIAAHHELGWSTIELRLVDQKNVAGELSDDAFEEAVAKIEASGLTVTAFSSAIGNWSRKITDDFERDLRDLKIAVPRMNRLGVRFIRTMSWLSGDEDDDSWRQEAVRRYRELAAVAEEGDIYLAHENCVGWGGQSARHMKQLQEEVGSDHLTFLFDIGNTISHGYEPWEYYNGLKGLISYVHVKDCRRNPEGGRSADYTYPGEGDAMVREILADLLSNGYEGTIAIEPHVASIVHESGSDASPQEMYDSYLRYARQFEEIVADARTATTTAGTVLDLGG